MCAKSLAVRLGCSGMGTPLRALTFPRGLVERKVNSLLTVPSPTSFQVYRDRLVGCMGDVCHVFLNMFERSFLSLSMVYFLICDSCSTYHLFVLVSVWFVLRFRVWLGWVQLTRGRSPGAISTPPKGYPLWVGPLRLDFVVRVSAQGRPAPYPPICPCVMLLI